ncbi:MAG: helix-turn-helix transcriptional regulator [Thermosipho sp. (in: Bacteria)]|nr:helix-turn-helix transcriptional regulator [Thermosipho sp. (in: thermotogales)]
MRENLFKLRNKAKLTQEEVARKIGISRAAYSNIENGKRNPSFETMRKIATLFDTSVDEIFFDTKVS